MHLIVDHVVSELFSLRTFKFPANLAIKAWGLIADVALVFVPTVRLLRRKKWAIARLDRGAVAQGARLSAWPSLLDATVVDYLVRFLTCGHVEKIMHSDLLRATLALWNVSHPTGLLCPITAVHGLESRVMTVDGNGSLLNLRQVKIFYTRRSLINYLLDCWFDQIRLLFWQRLSIHKIILVFFVVFSLLGHTCWRLEKRLRAYEWLDGLLGI